MTSFVWGTATDTGRVRQANEDSLGVLTGAFIVADGMGGHQAGEVASSRAIDYIERALGSDTDVRTTDSVVAAVERANRELVALAQTDPGLAGMGTTVVVLSLVDVDGRDALGVANVGDSRLYLLSDGDVRQVTEDHSLVATLERQGRLTAAEAAVHPQRNILTRALGIEPEVKVDSWELVPVIGDRYLLCTDGLTNEVDDDRIASVLRRLADPADAARELVRLANEGGGHDNITVIVVDVVDDEGRDPGADLSRRISAVRVIDEFATSGSQPGAMGAPSPDTAAHDDDRGRARRRNGSDGTRIWSTVTVRVVAFVGAVVLVVLVAFGFLLWIGTASWFVGVDEDRVAIFRGKPGGFLWMDPSVAETTTLRLDQVPPASVDAVQDGVQQSSRDAARRYVANLVEQYENTIVTTTTTVPPTTIAPPATFEPTDPAPAP